MNFKHYSLTVLVKFKLHYWYNMADMQNVPVGNNEAHNPPNFPDTEEYWFNMTDMQDVPVGNNEIHNPPNAQEYWYNMADMQNVPVGNNEAHNPPNFPDVEEFWFNMADMQDVPVGNNEIHNPPNAQEISYKLALVQMRRQLDVAINEYQARRTFWLQQKDGLVAQYMATLAHTNNPLFLAPIFSQIETINYEVTRLDQENDANMRHRDEVINSLKSESLLVVRQLADANALLELRRAPHFWNGRVFLTANGEEGVDVLLQGERVDFEAEAEAA
ncbi:hypothetical protein Cgig2_002462 [Carnegiea gigantea]|uniref:Uncharacterized protein n=1 Tax=Carnegiea gigantea TaxID=171969 RepID=A0A9Q1KT29_9CARY|nr:hypothetical protein Cgig2_002462 [Carnegiea gigantea]